MGGFALDILDNSMRKENRLLSTPLEFARFRMHFHVFSMSYDVFQGIGPF